MRKGLKKTAALLLAFCMVFALSACSVRKNKTITLNVYAPIDSILAVSGLVDKFSRLNENIVLTINYDDNDMHAAKIEAGYDCDIYICDEPICMNWLDAEYIGAVYNDEAKTPANPNENDKIYSDSRVDAFKGKAIGEDDREYDQVFTAAICKSTQHFKEAQLFIDFLFSEEAAEIYKVGEFEMLEKPAN
ncbi:MAG: hypothetical protein IJM08_00565 [Firmicutes bacterium]|nr:hypothetical protein [Bacillota bacterium]